MTAGAADKEFNFEASLKELESLVTKMRQGDLPLDDSLKLFEQGVQLVRKCHTQLETAEKRVEVLLSRTAGGEWNTAPFNPET